ncbi:TlpA family protein disulfide reductase [Chitiniphilus eburneus]|uniref:TlpA family protein disulfide reductase n=1 Tax=Chitiniphilus eburneus TaxID=2571148 RepID=A0A4U0QAP2_9NEIS|nr:TlpA disulfide reductase family protein [Chitiniphilus eburneus]TJZ77502.1 TlpA family protein disulfide reductase [Chitiniphilus eburneus]
MKRLGWTLLVLVIAGGIGYLLLGQQRDIPQASWTTLQGKKQQLVDLKGNVILVNFWATTCTGCMAEMPKLVSLQDKLKTLPYKTLAVAMSYDDRARIDHYVARTALPFIVTHDTTDQISSAFGDIQLTPTSFLIDKEGRIVQRYVGEPDMKMLEAKIRSLI